MRITLFYIRVWLFVCVQLCAYTFLQGQAKTEGKSISIVVGVVMGSKSGGQFNTRGTNIEVFSESDLTIQKKLKRSFESEKEMLDYVTRNHMHKSNAQNVKPFSICVFDPAIGFGEENPMANYINNVFKRRLHFLDHDQGCDVVEFGNPFLVGHIDFTRFDYSCDELNIQEIANVYRKLLRDSVLAVSNVPGPKRYQGEFYSYCKNVP